MPFFVDGPDPACPTAGIDSGLAFNGIPLPNTDFAFLFPEEPKLNEQTSPRKNITENFSNREKNDITVIDPLLMAEENSMLIDLSLVQKEDYAFPLPGAKVISPYAGRRKHHSGVDLKTCSQ